MSEQSGFPFPAIKRGVQGSLNFVSNNTLELVKSSVYQILTTAPGERPWNPEFGCDIQKLMFETLTDTISDTIASLVYEALTTWEPRIELQPSDVDVRVNNGKVTIMVSYGLVVPAESESDSLLVIF